ncbi:MAG TPA: hypothetical protein VJ890_11135 [Vineibacter sp.]|nr:hypothetical protein [Vineibacter sp.]
MAIDMRSSSKNDGRKVRLKRTRVPGNANDQSPGVAERSGENVLAHRMEHRDRHAVGTDNAFVADLTIGAEDGR